LLVAVVAVFPRVAHRSDIRGPKRSRHARTLKPGGPYCLSLGKSRKCSRCNILRKQQISALLQVRKRRCEGQVRPTWRHHNRS
jgi:hypothetical protein